MPFRILKRPSSHYFIQCVSHGCRSCASTARNVPSPLSVQKGPHASMPLVCQASDIAPAITESLLAIVLRQKKRYLGCYRGT
ncbi:hypothetical protein ECG_02895 [Echinococcus granulosus]|uniref:Secreted protein n=1 Tax=Echinococcus granulosus TaxID=6210 RepID=A0A068WR80_ECHGR|nr:hypothetical protein ECG_02895 [Echinococcus granulosus]CDS20142.1 hypothetical protein EgrG_000234200 [Echinococcus granulosus]